MVMMTMAFVTAIAYEAYVGVNDVEQIGGRKR